MEKKRIVMAVMAHVDTGKTTLLESLLFEAGAIRSLGRVDKGNSFLDNNQIERDRGITVFSKQALISTEVCEYTLLDTPGHADLASEAERGLSVSDYAVLVISGTDIVQAHTSTLWDMLKSYNVPCFVFVSKMDISCYSRSEILSEMKKQLSPCITDFSPEADSTEEAALCDEAAMEEYLDTGVLCDNTIARMIRERKLFPCFFGSGLKSSGIRELISALDRFCIEPERHPLPSARVYKIGRDARDARMSFLKVTGGGIRVKSLMKYTDGNGEIQEEKIDEIRIYSGAKFINTDIALPGQICAVTGLSHTVPGSVTGEEKLDRQTFIEPVMSFAITFPNGEDPAAVMPKLQRLSEEEPMLNVCKSPLGDDIRLNLLGPIQKEVVTQLCRERFGLETEIGDGRVMYRETITGAVEGVGHYEPLRHYAEVHLILEPMPAGSGITAGSICREDQLDRNWQRLITTHIFEKQHIGVLTGSPLTDVRITIASGKAHIKHTEGGDFRQATYRAIRQGLMKADSVLLEPWYSFRLSAPADKIGRAMSDIRAMQGEFTGPIAEGSTAYITGFAPVSEINSYPNTLAAYTGGKGRISFGNGGYRPVKDQTAVVAAWGYNPQADQDNSPDSVFCDHGAGFNVPWDRVEEYMHLESCM